jgi:5-methylcytosine-specific restriction endonuclease McrA
MDTLLLNADGLPVSLLPLSVINWQESIRYLVLEKATAIAWYDNWVVRSVSYQTNVPAILLLKDYMKPKTVLRYSKANVFLRDGYRCQYCYSPLIKKTCTLDHVIPTSLGGTSTWENPTTACGPCNANKGNNKKIVPKAKPYKPTYWELVNRRKKLANFEIRHKSWLEFLS